LTKILNMTRCIALAIAVSFFFTCLSAQNGQTSPVSYPRSSNSGMKSYSEVITSKAKTDHGLFTVHRVEDKFYFEIPDSLLGREILVVNRISKAPAGGRSGFLGYA